MTVKLASEFEVHTCPCKGCGVTYALPLSFAERRRQDGAAFYCPNGHHLSYDPNRTSDAAKLRDARAKETALRDQLSAAIREGDSARSEVLRIRQRIANGICPCCTRSFPNVMAHMATKHPDYALPENVKHATEGVPFRCSCRAQFKTYQGLRIHQGTQRSDDWDAPDASRWSAHLTVA